MTHKRKVLTGSLFGGPYLHDKYWHQFKYTTVSNKVPPFYFNVALFALKNDHQFHLLKN